MTSPQNTLPRDTATAPNVLNLFLPLFAFGMLGVFFFSLIVVRLLPSLLEGTGEAAPPTPLLIAVMLLQYGALTALATWGGLALSRRMDRNPAPLLSRAITDYGWLFIGMSLGLVTGLITLWLHASVFGPLTGVPRNITTDQPLWLGLGNAFFYGGITEELLMRLGLMTLLIWIATRVLRRDSGDVFWAVNVIVWILFGLG
ncbi:MAG: hypothetical protein AAF125_13295, partial [Chloroflexota bacterium]